MSERRNKDYINFIFKKSVSDLGKYNVGEKQFQTLQDIIDKLLRSENLIRDLYILYHIKEFRNTGKYLIYILKKLDDNLITFDNLTQNAKEDSEFLHKEFLNYLSGERSEALRINSRKVFDLHGITEDEDYSGNEIIDVESELIKQDQLTEIIDEEDDEEMMTFKQNYMELIQSEEENENAAFVLPGLENEEQASLEGMSEEDPEFDLPGIKENKLSESGDEKAQNNTTDVNEQEKENFSVDENLQPKSEESASGENSIQEEEDKESNSGDLSEVDREVNNNSNDKPKDLSYDDSGEYFIIKKVLPAAGINKSEESDNDNEDTEELNIKNSDIYKEEFKNEHVKEYENSDQEEKINLNSDIQEELNKYEKELKEKLLDHAINHNAGTTKSDNSDESVKSNGHEEDEEIKEEKTTNEEFIKFESEIKSLNGKLNSEFDSLIYIITAKIDNEEERNNIINNIRDISDNLELTSKEMSLEIISNIYQAVRLSFEKIAKGKYDITESTLNLFKQGLILVSNLIKGEDYFGYKNILKSIENIRKGLIEENKKREEFIRQRDLKKEIETKLDERFPEREQKEKLIKLKKLIKDTDENFKDLYKIEGEFQIYEALRSLSSNLNNLKEAVLIAKDLKLTKMVQLSEAGYIFLKFLNSYRINPVTDDIKEIFSYFIYNMKALIIDKEVEDQDVFISYLNDPVKIFNKIKKT
ncbi:MAG: hypothetical protein WAT71_11025 [Ignavibacteria bacterium]